MEVSKEVHLTMQVLPSSRREARFALIQNGGQEHCFVIIVCCSLVLLFDQNETFQDLS